MVDEQAVAVLVAIRRQYGLAEIHNGLLERVAQSYFKATTGKGRSAETITRAFRRCRELGWIECERAGNVAGTRMALWRVTSTPDEIFRAAGVEFQPVPRKKLQGHRPILSNGGRRLP